MDPYGRAVYDTLQFALILGSLLAAMLLGAP